MTVTDLYALNSALEKDENEIRIQDPALTEIKVLLSSDVNMLKNMLKGGGLGFALAMGGVLDMFTGAFLLPLALMAAGVFKMGKAITYDTVKGIKTDNQLKEAQNQISNKYKEIDIKRMFELIKTYYSETSSGNSYSVLKHK